MIDKGRVKVQHTAMLVQSARTRVARSQCSDSSKCSDIDPAVPVGGKIREAGMLYRLFRFAQCPTLSLPLSFRKVTKRPGERKTREDRPI